MHQMQHWLHHCHHSTWQVLVGEMLLLFLLPVLTVVEQLLQE
jgi:hypothetical protein